MFTIKRDPLVKELGIVSAAVSTRSVIPVLAFCLLDVSKGRTKITGSNCDITISTSIPCDHDVDWSGCLPAKQLLSLARLLDGEDVLFAPDGDGRMKIECGKSKHRLPRMGADTFPVADKTGESTPVVLPAEILSSMVSTAAIAAGFENDSNPAAYLKSIYLSAANKTLEAVGTTGEKLSSTSFAIAETCEFELLIPREASSALVSFLPADMEATVWASEKHLRVEAAGRLFMCRLLDGKLPNWKSLRPHTEGLRARVATDALTLGVKRAVITSKDERWCRTMKMEVAKNQVIVESRENDLGASIEVVESAAPEMNGDSFICGVNALQLLGFLGAAGTDEIFIQFWPGGEKRIGKARDGSEFEYDSVCPLRFSPVESQIHFEYFTMPARLD